MIADHNLIIDDPTAVFVAPEQFDLRLQAARPSMPVATI